jgi:hypothetical protein
MKHVLILTCDQDPDWIQVTVHDHLQSILDYMLRYLESELQDQEPTGDERSRLIDRIVSGIQESHDFTLYGYRYRIEEAEEVDR